MGKVTLKEVYEHAQKEKGEDRITKDDIKASKKFLGYKESVPQIKDYMSKGGNAAKPVKAVLGVLALGAAGAIGAKKLMKKKSSAVSSDDVKYTLKDKNMVTDLYQKATKQETAKMNVGGEVEVMKGGDYIKDLID
jgi:uncharacterized protein HemX|tara:strand:- start:43 stop:450 length:408 start_codon:yes stop_codon:yes gene_type:complete